ncbi:MAG TPA: hypothetical protein VNB22_06500 [Pyrinomonadaceae bacterium]|nr:hypothetical protein [Pyrinomonadaceae bacterium]
MIENIPGYVSITFILTTFLTVGFLLYAVKQTVFDTIPAKILIFLLAFWLFFQAILALYGFYLNNEAFPPRVAAFGIFPALLLIIAYFIFFRKTFIEPLPLKILTLLSIIRIPVEIVLMWLAHQQLVPQSMTFEGRNFDILSGITAPLIYFLAFRGGRVNRPLLIGWNFFALVLLLNVVITAILAFPSISPQLAPEFQARAVAYFPFIWLPAVVVPIVLFSHLASLWKLLKNSSV